jgi:Flp pilus assembly protein TadG
MNAAPRHHRAKGQRGSISVEAALLLPIFMALTLAFVDFGRLMWTQTVVNSAAAEAARLAVLPGPTDSAVADLATRRVLDGGVKTAPSVVVGLRSPNVPVAVTVSVGFDFLMLADLMPDLQAHRVLSSTSVMVHQP